MLQPPTTKGKALQQPVEHGASQESFQRWGRRQWALVFLMMLIKGLACELMGLHRSLISHLMSTFHDNTNANGRYCSLNLHDGTSKCKRSQWVLMSVRKKSLTSPQRLWNAFQKKRLNLAYYQLLLFCHVSLFFMASPNRAVVPKWHPGNRPYFYKGEVTGCSGYES